MLNCRFSRSAGLLITLSGLSIFSLPLAENLCLYEKNGSLGVPLIETLLL